ncbi:Ribonuclease H-like domain containing protein [Elaphomyces granulatus]
MPFRRSWMKYLQSPMQIRTSLDVVRSHVRSDLRIGSSLVIPEKFIPPNETDTPQLLFPPGIGVYASSRVHRFIHRNNPTQMLIYTDGACLDNGGENPRGGCAFVFRPSTSGYVAFRLENEGPTGQRHQQTSNRAELRAVIGALRFRAWMGDGFETIVVATDSEYVVNGSTNYIRSWLQNGWKKGSGTPVENKDLWLALLRECEQWHNMGPKIKFWKIPRKWNTEADRWAGDAANKPFSDKISDIN